MRIGITGVPGTGKTELAAALAGHFKLPLIALKIDRLARSLGINLSRLSRDKNLAREFQTAALLEQIKAEDACSEGFVTDRTGIDYLTHWEYYGLINSVASQTYREQCLSRKYDVLVYISYHGSDETLNMLDARIVVTLVLDAPVVPLVVVKKETEQ